MDACKQRAAYKAVDEHLPKGSDLIIGIGSGSTVVFAVDRLSQIQKETSSSSMNRIKACVPTSFQSEELILSSGLPLATLNQFPDIQVTFDGADEVDSSLNLIKGGGGCLLQEKLVASASQKLVIMVDSRKDAEQLGTMWTKGVPIEVVPSAYVLVSRKIKSLGGNPVLRTGSGKAGPLVTDNGNFILDVVFEAKAMQDPASLDTKLQNIPGIVETGLFVGLTSAVYIGLENGEVKSKLRNGAKSS